MPNLKPANRVILCVLDGWGIAPPGPGNAITQANPKNFESLKQKYPYTQLEASGFAVGLPADHDGNSETGHLNIGAGRIVHQDLARINMSIADGSFFNNPALLSAIEHVKKNNSSLHLLGLIGSSGVHAYNEHLYALLMLAARHNLKSVYLHLITDGRDSQPDDSPNQIEAVQQKIKQLGVGQIATIFGRYYAMDRDMRLDRTEKAFDCLMGRTTQNSPTALDAIKDSYEKKITDEFIIPTTIGPTPSTSRLRENDALIFYNFRIDRPRQLTKMILDYPFKNFHFVTMTQYHVHFQNPVAFPSALLFNTLTEVVSKQGLRQLHAAESEKERFVTYYFNGQIEDSFPGEDRLIVASPKIATYDLKPEMSSSELVDAVERRWLIDDYSLCVVNIACPDMVAHTGMLQKAIQAIKATDKAIGRLHQLAQKSNSFLVITADHGNAEEMLEPGTNDIDTKHSIFPVPLIIYHPFLNKNVQLSTGVLGDIAPTILHLMHIPQPLEMTGHNLIRANQLLNK